MKHLLEFSVVCFFTPKPQTLQRQTFSPVDWGSQKALNSNAAFDKRLSLQIRSYQTGVGHFAHAPLAFVQNLWPWGNPDTGWVLRLGTDAWMLGAVLGKKETNTASCHSQTLVTNGAVR